MAALVQRQLGGLLGSLLPHPHETSDSTRSAGLTTTFESVTSTDSVTLTFSPTPSSSSGVISLTQGSSSASSTQSLNSTSTTLSSTAESSSIFSSIIPVVPTSSADNSTDYVTITPSPSPSPSPSVRAAPANSSGSFLQNKTLSGVVFAVVGVVVLVLLVAIATLALRKSRKKRLHNEAISFDPSSLGGTRLGGDSVEKRRFSLLSSDNGHSVGSHPGAYNPTAPAYPRQDPYRYAGSESQHNLMGQRTQQPYYGETSYGATHHPQPNLRPAWNYGNDLTPVQPSQGPSSPDRIHPSDLGYLQAGNFQISNA